ncbi:hypothetical protein OT109_10905 [Phycisphaeraceae bacterium D3-23]
MPAWHHWYHCMANTFGTWLPGDPRGFRTKHHREHAEGDYKNPPPAGKYDGLHTAAQNKMRRPPIVLNTSAQRSALVAIVAIVEAFGFHHIEFLCAAVSNEHLHVLARFEPRDGVADPPRHYLGIAKKQSAKALVAAGLAEPGGVWARKGKIVPITDRSHQVNVFRYIQRHAQQGAAVWTFKDQQSDSPQDNTHG